VGYVAGIREIRNMNKILDKKSEGKSHLRDLDVDGRIILKLILTKRGVDWIQLA
jgi:uncharacterized protein with PhoU and TrkA domain